MSFKFVDYIDVYPPVIARENIKDHFPWLSVKTLNDLESKGNGPSGIFYVGRKKLYPTEELLIWLDSRARLSPKSKIYNHTSACSNEIPKSRRGRKTKAQQIKERRG